MIRPTHVLGALMAGVLFSAGAAHAQGSGSATVDAIKARGQLVCGVAGGVPGFSLPDSQGVMRGLRRRYLPCHGGRDPGRREQGQVRAATTTNRFTALQSGEVDMLSRSTTWTLGREGNLGLLFAGVNYYDGTGFLVKKAAGVKSAKELDGATICVQPGTTTELAIADYYRLNNMKFTPILIQDLAEIRKRLPLRPLRRLLHRWLGAGDVPRQPAEKDNLVLLPETISKEPLALAVRKGDDKWFDVVRWTFIAMMTAEETASPAPMTSTASPPAPSPKSAACSASKATSARRSGSTTNWAYNVIKQVGNFGETWDRNITPLGVPRGINNLWNKGGLQYAPPMR